MSNANMEFKVLKHKTLEDTYGVFHIGDNCEIWQKSTPHLFQTNMTLDYLKQTYQNSYAAKQLDDYELITVKVEAV